MKINLLLIKLLFLLSVLLFITDRAMADSTVNSATVDGASSTSVSGGASISVNVNVLTTGNGANGRWRSTAWRIAGTSGALTCVDHTNYQSSSGNFNEIFTVTAPATVGTYNLYLVSYRNNGCSQGASTEFVLSNAVTVAPSQLLVSTGNVSQGYDVFSYGGSQDRTGTVEIRDAGLSLFLEGNRWQRIDFPYTVTANTVIEFDFESTNQGEIHGLGFDDDLVISSNRSFRVYGTQNWGLSNFATYPGSGVTHYTIPVGQYYTGNFQYLFFINDDDSNPTGNGLYSNINVYELGSLPQPLAEYHFDELAWNGTSGEVLDSSGNNNHAFANAASGLTTIDLGQVCRAGEFDGIDDYIESSSIFNALRTTASLSFWIKTTQTGDDTGWRAPGIAGAELSGGSDDIFWGWLDASGRIGISVANDFSSKSTVAINNGVFRHVVLTRDSATGAYKIYIDGSLDNSGTIGSGDIGTSFSSIGRIEDTGGSPEYFQGDLDEVLIFNSVLSDAEVNSIYTEQLARNNYDGSPRTCPVIPPATCNNGRLNAVGIKIDGAGSNTQINTTTEALAIHSAWLAAGSPALGLIDGGTYNVAASGSSSVDRIDFGGSGRDFTGTLAYPGVGVGVTGSDFLVHTSGILSLPAGDYSIFVKSDDGFSFILNSISGDSVSFNKFGSSSAGASNELRFETPTANSNTGGSFTLTQDSVFDIAAIFFERGGGDFLEISIANNIRTNSAPSGYEILRDGALGGTVRLGNCAVPLEIDHYEITHDGAALTCSGETLTIRACTNTACTTVSDTDVVVDLSATGTAPIWSQNPVTIPGGSVAGVTVDLINRTAETITLDATSATAATNPVTCIPDCNLTFSEAGFILSLSNHQSCTTQNLVIQAVQMSDTGNSCAPAYVGNQLVNFTFNYNNPSTGSRIPILDAATMAAASVSQSRSINFDTNASSTLAFQYNDAGQIDITVSDGADNGLTSATISPIVRPAKLLVSTSDTNNACAGPDYGNCTAFKTAGTPGNTDSEFNLAVAGACSDDSITPNFQLNNIALTSNLVAPIAGTNGALGVPSVDITTNGTATVTQTVSEVGAFSITATPGNYLGQFIPAATSNPIGRFVPQRFLITDNSPMLDDATCDFTYQDQETAFAPGLAPEITVTAVNSAGVITANYGGDGVSNNDFWNFNAADYSGRTYSNQATPFPGTVTAALGAVTISGQSDYDGIHLISFYDDAITHNKAGVIPEATNDATFNAQVQLTLDAASLTDGDGIFYDLNNDLSADSYLSTTIDGTNIRWGRWSLENGYGSELQAIVMNLTAQYFNGSQFITSTTDNCTSAVATNLSNYSGSLNAGETTLSLTSINNGIIPVSLSAPGTNNTGSVLITVTTPSWLQYDYDGDGSLDDVKATATFGIFEGRRPIIIKRQNY